MAHLLLLLFLSNKGHVPNKYLVSKTWIFVYTLTILAINRHFWHYRQIRLFRQNCHFPKGPFAISFEFCLAENENRELQTRI